MRLWCELAWLGGDSVSAGVLVEIEGGLVSEVTVAPDPPADAQRLEGLVIPGIANSHSHAFQRALRGRAEQAGDRAQGSRRR